MLLYQFLVLAGNRQFFCCGGNVLLRPRKKKVLVVCLAGCAVVSVFGSGGKLVLVVDTSMYLEYHTVVVLCSLFWFWREIVFGVTYVLSVQYSCTGRKKSSSRLSGGCAIIIKTGKKSFI